MRGKRLAQTGNAACLNRLLTHGIIIESGHEDDRKRGASRLQFLPYLKSGQSPEVNIKEKTIKPICSDSAEEFFGR